MAEELNMQSKHSIEKQTAHYVDCFTTVSEITNNECKELLDKPADVVLMNGFEDDFVPKGTTFTGKRKRARSTMLRVANCLMGTDMGDDTLIIGTSGRYEFKNKGIDVFLESLNRLNRDKNLEKNVLAFINVPGWVGDAREDLQQRLKSKEKFTTPLEVPLITHWLHNMTHDQVLDMLKYMGMSNRPEDKVKIIFVPCYLDGKDGIINKQYYDLILGEDIQALRAGQIHAGDCCVLRFMGLRGRFGTTAFTFQEELKGLHELYNSCAIITDGRFSGGTSGLSIGYVSPEAALGSPLGVIEEGDEVEIDIPARKLHLCISDEEMNRRLAAFHWEFPSKDYPRYLTFFLCRMLAPWQGSTRI